jgi:hypothetical protein
MGKTYLSMSLPSFCWTLAAFQLLNPIYIRQDSLDGGSTSRKAATYTQNKRTKTSMHQVEFEPRIRVFEQAKTVQAIDHAATLIGGKHTTVPKIWGGTFKSSALTIVHVGGETVMAIVAGLSTSIFPLLKSLKYFAENGPTVLPENRKTRKHNLLN